MLILLKFLWMFDSLYMFFFNVSRWCYMLCYHLLIINAETLMIMSGEHPHWRITSLFDHKIRRVRLVYSSYWINKHLIKKSIDKFTYFGQKSKRQNANEDHLICGHLNLNQRGHMYRPAYMGGQVFFSPFSRKIKR